MVEIAAMNPRQLFIFVKEKAHVIDQVSTAEGVVFHPKDIVDAKAQGWTNIWTPNPDNQLNEAGFIELWWEVVNRAKAALYHQFSEKKFGGRRRR